MEFTPFDGVGGGGGIQVLTQLLILFNWVETKEGIPTITAISETGSEGGKEDIGGIIKQIRRLIRAMPNGDEYLTGLETTLSREKAWIQWKLDKCPAMEVEVRGMRRGGKNCYYYY